MCQKSRSRLPQAVLFDLDGTLVDTIGDLATAIDMTRVDFGLAPIGTAIAARYVGHGIEPFVTAALAHGGGARVAALDTQALAHFREHYRAVNGVHSVLYPAVVNGLRRWRSTVQGMAVVTNKSSEFALPLLQRMDLAGFFDVIVCGDTLAQRKPNPAPVLYACRKLAVEAVETLLIGDSINDALAARAAGVRALAVPYGYHGNADVRELPVEAVVPDITAAVVWAASNWRPRPLPVATTGKPRQCQP